MADLKPMAFQYRLQSLTAVSEWVHRLLRWLHLTYRYCCERTLVVKMRVGEIEARPNDNQIARLGMSFVAKRTAWRHSYSQSLSVQHWLMRPDLLLEEYHEGMILAKIDGSDAKRK
jgi:hypothetical protein